MRTVRSLIEGRDKIVMITEDASARDALEKMFEHDYHQLPIVAAGGRPVGMVSIYSLSRVATFTNAPLPQVPLRPAIERARPFNQDDDITDVLAALKEEYAVLVVNDAAKLVGIVTPYDAL